jgi:hypothetical protein
MNQGTLFNFPKKPRARQMITQPTGKCACGNLMYVKDHGTWEGHFCPKCLCGGSNFKRKVGVGVRITSYDAAKWR